MMKKITIVLLSLLCITSVAIADETVDVWSGSQSLKPWTSDQDPEQYLAVSYGQRSNLETAFMNDIVVVSYTMAESQDNYSIRFSDPAGWNDMEGTEQALSYATGTQTYSYEIKNVANLDIIQYRGIIVRGANVTITQVQLTKVDNRYDAVPVTIGADGIATFSTSSKKLDFSGTSIYPYYASAIEEGTVTLTKLTDQITYGWQGYILQGPEGSYEIPVTTSNGTYPGPNYLRPCGDYSTTVYRSVYTGYTGGGDDETNIKTKYRYIFAKDNSTGDKGFYKLTTDHTLGAHKAYLETTTDITPTTPGAPAIHLVFEEENGATALEQFEANDEVLKFIENGQLFIRKNGVTYDLMGRTVK